MRILTYSHVRPPERVAKVRTQQLACACPWLSNISFLANEMFFYYPQWHALL